MSDSDKAAAELAFGVLGPLEATYAGAALPLGGGRQRAVLALLVCEASHAVPVERLLQGLWGEALPAGAVASVQTYVFHLRQLLEPGRARGSPGSVLVTVPGGYRLDVDRRCVDMTRFENGVAAGDDATKRQEPDRAVTAYTEALSLWRGDVLADLVDYDFVAPYRARLDELRASAQQSRVQAELDQGHHLGVIGELGVLLSENPLREGLHAQRILALYRSGRQSDALAAYRELRSVLDTELGIEPSAPLQELNTRVLRQDPLLDWKPLVRSPDVRVATTVSPGPPATQDPPHPTSYVVEGQRRRLPALAVVTAAVAVLAGGAALPIVEAPTASAAVAANSVSEIDASGRVLASVPVGTNPIAVTASAGAIWAVNASDDTVSKINPATHAVQQVIDVGHEPRAVALTGDDLWVTNFRDGTVSRINVLAGRVIDEITVGSGPDAIAAGPAGLWVANSGDNTIQRIDAKSGVPATAVVVGDGPDGLAVDDVSVWVANGRSGSVMRISAQTGDPMTAPIPVGSGPRGIVRLGDDVWVADELSQSVTRIPVATYLPHPIDVGDGPTALTVLDGSVWVSEEYSGDLIRIDPDSETADRVEVNAAVHGIAVGDGHLWVASGAFPSARHRGGTLRVAAHVLPGKFSGNALDPAGIYDFTSHEATRMVYDGLLAYHYSAADSQVLVPDLAIAKPEPTDGGKTYTFNLRPGIRYSTGTEVRASDFVRGVHRALLSETGRPVFYAGIVGAKACIHDPTSCDLNEGVVADDVAGTVTFHLVAPDPEFLYKLTLFIVPAPPGTPLRQVTSHPLPGTGPYQIAIYDPGIALTMTRNRYFDEWSAPAQPAGFADVVTWVKVGRATRAAADAVLQGRADLAELTPLGPKDIPETAALVDELSLTHPSRVHKSLGQVTDFAVINSSTLPFSKRSARRAFNYAVDRRKVVDLLGGPLMAVATCQLMPPTMPSYQPYCPYTTGSPEGDYVGPDLPKARALVRRSGTQGMKVTVFDIVHDYNPELDRYFAHVLRTLGYDVALDRVKDNDRTEDRFYHPRDVFPVESGGWGADYPLPSNFYDIIACATSNDGYPFGYCNRELDARAAAAIGMFQDDPGAALRAWTDIERDLTDDAPLVPVANFINWWMASQRVGNYQTGAESLGPLMSQLWVQ